MSENIIIIGHIIGKLMAGGVEKVVFSYIKEFTNQSIEIFIFYEKGLINKLPKNIFNVKVRYIQLPPFKNIITYILVLRHYFRRIQFFIIHSHLNSLSFIPLYIAYISKIKIRIAHSHSTASIYDPINCLIKYLIRPFSKLIATNYFACSKDAAVWLFGANIINNSKYIQLNNGIDMNEYKYNYNIRKMIRNKLNIDEKFVLGHVGRFSKQKNHKYLLRVFFEIQKKISNSVLLLVGDGPQKQNIINTAKKFKILDSIYFIGIKECVSQYYQGMDAFIFPSLYEGLGLVALEAQISGLCVYASDNIPNEVILNKNFHKLKLSLSPKKWADLIVKNSNNINRECVFSKDNFYKSGFCIHNEAKKLEKFYLSFL